jgi:hypothetical protein
MGRANVGVGTGAILDYDGLAERLRHPERHDAVHHIDHSAGRVRHNDANRLGGSRLRSGQGSAKK